MAESNADILSDAVARNVGAVLSVPTAGMLRHLKTRFLGDQDDSLWLETEESAGGLLDTVAREGQGVGVSFKTGTRKIMFATKVLERRPDFRVNATVSVAAVRVTRPSDIKSVQRRTNYRVRVGGDGELLVRVWRIPEKFDLRDRPTANLEMHVETRDLSLGGISLLVKSAGGDSDRRVVDGQRLRIQLTHRGAEVLLEAYVRHGVDTPGGQQRLGVQFVNTDADLAGRQAISRLNAIVAALAREEVRQLRLTS